MHVLAGDDGNDAVGLVRQRGIAAPDYRFRRHGCDQSRCRISHGQLYPGRTIEELKKLRTDWPARGPMTLTGPIFVNGAEPGDTPQIKIQKIVPRPWVRISTSPGCSDNSRAAFPTDR